MADRRPASPLRLTTAVAALGVVPVLAPFQMQPSREPSTHEDLVRRTSTVSLEPIETITADGEPLVQEAPVLNCYPDLPTDPQRIQSYIDQDIEFRSGFGFRADRAFVESLYSGEANIETCWIGPMVGMLLTLDEAHIISLNQYLGNRADGVYNFIIASPFVDRFAGLEIDNNNGTIRIHLTGDEVPAELADQVASLAGGRQYVSFSDSRYSLAELEELQRELSDSIWVVREDDVVAAVFNYSGDPRHTARGAGALESFGEPDPSTEASGTYVDISNNSVVIELHQRSAPSDDLRSQVDDILDDLALDSTAVTYLQAAGYPAPATQTAANTPTASPTDPIGPPWFGGTLAGMYNGTTYYGNCTNGFVITDYNNPGSHYMLTAGHCWHVPNGPWVNLPNKVVGADHAGQPSNTVQGGGAGYLYDPLNTEVDLGIFRVVNDQAANKVCHPTNGTCKGVTSMSTGTKVGQLLYRIGASSQNVSGATVMSTSASLPNGFDNLIKTSHSIKHGDSGGPLYKLNPDGKATMIGTISFCYQNSAGACISGQSFAISMAGFADFSLKMNNLSGGAISGLVPYLG